MMSYSHEYLRKNLLNNTQTISPSLIGTRVAVNVAEREGKNRRNLELKYENVCADFGVLIFSKATQNKALLTKMMTVAVPVLGGELKPKTGHVDNNVYGIFCLELYLQTRIEGYLRIGRSLADQQYAQIRPDGLTDQARFWADDMWMICSLQTQAYKATGESKYLDRAVGVIMAYAKRLQSANGLFYHTENSHFFWGRSNGWAAASLAQTLLAAADHAKRQAVMKIYRTTMNALIRFQGRSGMWHQLLDFADSFEETSCTGMFVYALATGVTNHWLISEKYRRAAMRGWSALSKQVDKHGNALDTCIETDEGYDANYYLSRPTRTGDFHGQAGMLWAASAMLQLVSLPCKERTG